MTRPERPRRPAVVARRHRLRARGRRRHPRASVRSSRSTGSPEPGLRAAGRAVPGCSPRHPVRLRRWRRAPWSRAHWRDVRAFGATLREQRVRRDPRPAGAGEGRADRAPRARRAPRLRPREHPRAARDARRRRPSSRAARPAFRRRAAGASPLPRWATRPTRRRAGTCDRRPCAGCAGTAVRRPAARDEPRGQAVARSALARADAGVRARGFASVLPWGSADEEARSRRLAARVLARDRAAVARAADVAALLAQASRCHRRRHRIHASRRRAGHADRRDLQRDRSRAARRRVRRRACARCRRRRRVADAGRRSSTRPQRRWRCAVPPDGARFCTRCCGGSRCRCCRCGCGGAAGASRGYREHIGERFGRYAGATRTAGHDVLWIHAVSLGETRAVAPLVERLLREAPRRTILLTHMTATGRETGRRLFGSASSRRGCRTTCRSRCGAFSRTSVRAPAC